ncbi:hypothetical protein BDN72DRAFT_902943 [Pluteus cervinus]|uniref:Uncharacterized protein n=1 Tax=Pluteus cervinus TaxID=181527 RepID=A0ACD3AD86_9AGAR|nr:hypothetical protein BDN72DRAFT_902943 [Pluteus cervinus]
MRFTSYATIALSFVGAAIALPAVKRASASDLQTAINTLVSQISVSESILMDYSSAGDLLSPEELYNRLHDGGYLADAVTADAMIITALSEEDGQTIFSSLQNATPHLENFLQLLIADKSKFIGVPASGGIEALILQGLDIFTNSLTMMGNRFLAIAPADLQGPEAILFRDVTSAFGKVIEAYSS